MTATLTTLAQGDGVSLLELLLAGGFVGYVILLLSVVAVALAVMHALQIRMRNLAPEPIVDELHGLASSGDLDGAQRLCEDEANDAFLTRVFASALRRMRRSPLGALELKGAIEEAGQEQVSRLYRSTDGLGLIAAIAPMLGLLGTVVGMVGAFDTIASTEGFARPDQLAGNISQALVTTLMGLTLAIPATAAFTYFRNRIDALASEIGSVLEDLADVVEGAPAAGAPAAQPTQAAGQPAGSGA